MITRSISRLMLGLSLAAFNQGTEATQGTTMPDPLSRQCLDQLAKIDPPLPTVKEMLDVDPVQVPWGVNLNLVEEFGGRFRNARGLSDECNIAPRITNYQKNLSDLKKAEIVIPIIQDMIDSVNLNADTSLKMLQESKQNKAANDKEGALNPLLKKMGKLKHQITDSTSLNKEAGDEEQQKIEHDKEVALRPLLEKMNKLKRDTELARIGIDKNGNNYKIMRKIGLTPEQVAKLPDLDAWKTMKKELPLQRPQTKLPPRIWKDGTIKKQPFE